MLAVGLMSFSALLLELGLTRLFSVVLFYHFAFLAISVALLGLGAGAVFAFLPASGWRDGTSANWDEVVRRQCARHPRRAGGGVALRGLDASRLGQLRATHGSLSAAAVPFFITGLLFSIVFARHPARITQLYGADLLGGSLACLALVPLLNFFGGPNLSCLPRLRWRWREWLGPFARALGACSSGAPAAGADRRNFHGQLIDIVYAKGMKRAAPLYRQVERAIASRSG